MKRIFILKFLFIGFLFFVSQTVGAQVNVNAGFVNGLWFSKTPFFAGEDVRVYTVIQNQSGFDIIGVVKFFVDGKLLNQSDFSIVNGRLIEKWADWKVAQGEHNLSIQISDTKKIEIGQEPENINLISNISLSEKYNIDLDTDGDGIGNENDSNDDNDNFSDEAEKISGTNPLIFDESTIPKVESSQEDIANLEDRQEENTSLDGIVEKAIALADIATEKTNEIIKDAKESLEKQKEKIDTELEEETKEEETQNNGVPPIDKDKNPYVASLVGSIPELKEIYSFILAVLIYILNSWWILLGSILIALYFIGKIMKRMFSRGY